ncbi:bifunctional DNA-binding transcriptional regulator/O6-methylguanine-DNA methyltransferase Ada [Sphingomonas oligoaromativorans]|uniref:bifunctional DNA-binding transcriptional regulator/O6-methylguanine-DNA methyltransferase Ada n=1 Tax=Sphingomonas oligoaromativorans TaxID=575322 RepID=UPI00141F009B|nr:bifunctional DNA-binding transcriptional regulator/O6-methylguanine-DNA methyltransferase Ada [Sphingomonas oligoaromativorans]NIJ32623.1 AraC family transcriptional regulator of adaptative response/methylated-DNA-[protein]-cysteine methyltransferase [Sphingomonas oligoaromativorans]
MMPDRDEERWAAVLRRDRAADGDFVTGVLSTGIYCRPSCAARHPKRENVRFFADGEAARTAGLRPCLRCKPDAVARDAEGVARAVALIERSDTPPTLDEMAGAAGYAPHHFHRLFRKRTGVTPAAYARGVRARRMEQALRQEDRVTDAIYEAGYSGPGRFYEEAEGRLGMAPSAWRDGGRGATIRWATAPTSFGRMLVAATERGICRLTFGDPQEVLRRDFPNATLEPGGADMAALVASAVAVVEEPGRAHDLPLDVRGTAFQEAVWRELSRVPAGESVSYAALAARAGKPGAARAAGTACGANPVAILIPCHRARRGDGSPGGYAWGLAMKAELLEREAGEGRQAQLFG